MITKPYAFTMNNPTLPEDENWEEFQERVHGLLANYSDDYILQANQSLVEAIAHYSSRGRDAWETNIRNGKRLLANYSKQYLKSAQVTRIAERTWDNQWVDGVRELGLRRPDREIIARALLNLEQQYRDLHRATGDPVVDTIAPPDIQDDVQDAQAIDAVVDDIVDDVDAGEMIEDSPLADYIDRPVIEKDPKTGKETGMRQLIVKDHEPYYAQKIAGDITDIQILIEAIRHPDKQNILLTGETGLGKTMSLEAVAFLLSYPYISVNLNGGTTTESLIGQWIPSGSGFEWVDGLLTKMVRYGGLFVAEEINAANPETSFVLFPLLDRKRQMILTDNKGEIINAHPDFVFAATMNPADPEYTGVQKLNKALFDRFQIVLEYVGKNVSKVLRGERPLVEFYEKIKVMVKDGEIDGVASIRGLQQYQENVEKHGKGIAHAILLQKFEEGDDNRGVVDELLKTLGL